MKLLVIQTGDAVPEAQKYGNFDQWFITDIQDRSHLTVHVHQKEKLPDVNWAKEHISHIIITGSAAMITEQQSWMLSAMRWISQIIDAIPIMGVCFGHQMLADLLGGQVDNNPKGRNMGLAICHLNTAGRQHTLFQDMPHPSFPVWVSHLQAVLKLPTDCILLATSANDPNHAFQYRQHCFGIQFHPEWTGPIMAAYIKARQTDLANEGYNASKMLTQTQQNLQTKTIIKQFFALSSK